jgi:2-polyprenyl-6-hydroxyphenyl methylase/3-demethylubiquinone-9 3-methyltransferase
MATTFEFGTNWLAYLDTVSDASVAQSERELTGMLGDVCGRTFIDVGCGSGMSSLAAHRLGAIVRSFDYDPKCVECTRAMQQRFGASWPVERGSALDADYMRTLGEFDIVYSWGVLHHTGDMWRAIDNTARLVKGGGLLHLMLYRDAWLAPVWKGVKRFYSASPSPIQWIVRNGFAGVQILGLLLKGRNPRRVMRDYGKSNRGMSWYTDVTDWIGGYPFEYASAEQVIEHLKARGFATVKVYPEPYKKKMGWQGTGSYQYVFRRVG